MKPTAQPHEFLSALADGQLPADELTAAMEACRRQPDLLEEWSTYHLIGDVLRAPAQACSGSSTAFAARLASRLAAEAVVPDVQPLQRPAGGAVLPGVDGTRVSRPAANDDSFRWKMVAGFASLAAVSAIAWSTAGLFAPAAGPQLAQQQPAAAEQILVASPQGTMVRDARLEQMLAAHKQFGGTSALQVPSGFLRNATFETPQSAGR